MQQQLTIVDIVARNHMDDLRRQARQVRLATKSRRLGRRSLRRSR
jgi:hypothetical protein